MIPWHHQLLISFIASLFGSMPIGVLNTTTVHTAVKNGFYKAFIFICGILVVEYIQIGIAQQLNKLLTLLPDLTFYVNLACVPFFIFLSYFYWFHPPKQNQRGVKQQFFYKGMKISALNGIAIPFWMIFLHFFKKNGWGNYQFLETQWLYIGFSLGTLVTLMLYALSAHWLRNHLMKIEKWFYQFLSLLFLFLAGVVIFRLIYWETAQDFSWLKDLFS